MALDPSNSQVLYEPHGSKQGGGHTWRDINTGIDNRSMGRSAPVIVDPTNPRTLYVGSEGGGVVIHADAQAGGCFETPESCR